MDIDYKNIIESLSDTIYIYDFNKSQWTYISSAIFHITGFTAEEAINKNIQGLFTSESYINYKENLKIAVIDMETTGRTNDHTDDYKLVCKDGTSIWIELSENYKYNADGELEVIGSIRNSQERKSAETRLFQSEEKFRELFDRAPLGYQSLDIDGKFITVNEQWLNMLGYEREEVIGKWFGDFMPPKYQEGLKVRFPLFKSQGYIHSEFELYHKNGETIYIAFDGKIGTDERGRFKQTHCILKDITTQRQLEEDLDYNRDLLNSLIENTTDAIYIKDTEGKYLLINRAGEKIIGKSSAEIIGKDDASILKYIEGKKLMEADKKILEADSTVTLEEQITDENGKIMTYLSTKGPIFNKEHKLIGLFGITREISDRKKAEQKLIKLSYYDQLTGLHNRRFYEEEIARIDVATNLPIAMVMADVNGLKLTNDAFGHQEGDRLLKFVADILRKACSSDKMVSRIGGDEFVILLPRTSAMEAKKIIDSINEAVEDNMSSKGIFSLSIGYAVKEDPTDSMDNVFKEAEDDMYRQKLTENLSVRSNTIDLIMNSLYEKNTREMLHSNRVASICEVIATKMDFDQKEIKKIRAAGLVHDIGKIGISNNILDKEGKLTRDEWIEIQKHCEVGFRILNSVNDFSEIAKYVLSHQERWDGKGYPQRLKGLEIPIQSRVIAVADAFDAMTSDRTYRLGMSIEDAIVELKRCSGSQFDPEIVEIFVNKVISQL